jgi:hypothetical protein
VRGQGNPRRNAVLESVKKAGLLDGVRARIAGRIRKQLVRAAKTRSGIKSDTDLLEYALAQVALEDDFGQKLIAREGRVPQDIQLEFCSQVRAAAAEAAATDSPTETQAQ